MLESTTYKFAKCLQKRFGKIPNVTDHNYITNSYHVNVREKIDAFTKLKFESEFQKLSPGGYQNIAQIATLNHVNRLIQRVSQNAANGGNPEMDNTVPSSSSEEKVYRLKK